MPKHRVELLVRGTALAAALVVLPVHAASADVNGDSITSTGGGAADAGVYQPPSSAAAQVSAKARAAAALRSSMQRPAEASGELTRRPGATPDMLPPPPTGGYPSAYVANGWGFTIHKEGEGNPCRVGTAGCSSIGHKYYTCGPAATRNMVQAMTGINNSELTYEGWEGTDPSQGTTVAAIAATLNNHYSAYGGWSVHAPTSTTDLESYAMSDLYIYDQGLVQNVQTSYLSFFSGKSLTHYDALYGYADSGATLDIAEEWDPYYAFGSTPTYGNPYGKHAEAASRDYSAVHYSPSASLVV